MALALLVTFQKQKLQSSHPFGMLCTDRLELKGELVISEKAGRNFYDAQSLVDTRSVLII